jgi:hypothetical protein
MPYTIAAVAMLAVWAAGTFFFDAPGWIHILLSAGVALWVYGIVTRDAQKPAR